MKKLMVLSAIVVSGLMAKPASAQFGIHINLNLGARPVVVAPAPVYDAQYYYLPDVEAYYSVTNNCYYYNDGRNWVSAAYLPGAYRNYDWQHARRFTVNEPRPYLHNDTYRARYGGIEHRDWNRDDHAYADHDRFNQPNRGNYNDNRGNDNRWNNNNRGQQQPQPQQNDNRGNHNDNRGQQQAQPQQNNNRANGNNTNGQHFADNRINTNGYNRPGRN